jgi:hypothetical protein
LKDLEDDMAEWMHLYGPDGHVDGCDKIAYLVWCKYVVEPCLRGERP